ncbi:STAS domain-containing protein [Amycolatopsis sp. NBC_01480]|uniref:STAS domain-containing protein n=1 Tax=Amycolatopsis sp. NBC_01480 TaxID=2903562 RepID=UPI002E281452|nr:STAS domain-containing protein [Amycolatopsis sp. NBC_01480]
MSDVRHTDSRSRPIPDAVGELRLHVRRPAPGTAVIEVAGELDLNTAPRLAEVVEPRIRSMVGVVIIDLGRTTFLAVSGLRTLHRLHTLAREHDVDFYLDPAESRLVRRVLELLPLGCERPGITESLDGTRLPAPRGIPT